MSKSASDAKMELKIFLETECKSELRINAKQVRKTKREERPADDVRGRTKSLTEQTPQGKFKVALNLLNNDEANIIIQDYYEPRAESGDQALLNMTSKNDSKTKVKIFVEIGHRGEENEQGENGTDMENEDRDYGTDEKGTNTEAEQSMQKADVEIQTDSNELASIKAYNAVMANVETQVNTEDIKIAQGDINAEPLSDATFKQAIEDFDDAESEIWSSIENEDYVENHAEGQVEVTQNDGENEADYGTANECTAITKDDAMICVIDEAVPTTSGEKAEAKRETAIDGGTAVAKIGATGNVEPKGPKAKSGRHATIYASNEDIDEIISLDMFCYNTFNV